MTDGSPTISTEINVKTTKIHAPTASNGLKRKQSIAISPTQLPPQKTNEEKVGKSTQALGIAADAQTDDVVHRLARLPASTTYFSASQLIALRYLAGTTQYPPADTVWDSILSQQRYPIPQTRQQAKDMDASVTDIAKDMTENNPDTHNFVILLLGFLSLLKRSRANLNEMSPELSNALFLVKVFVKHFIASLDTAHDMEQQYECDRAAVESPKSGMSHTSFGSEKPAAVPGEKRRFQTVAATPLPKQLGLPGLVRHSSLLSFGSQTKFTLDIDPEVAGDPRPRAVQLIEAVIEAILEIRPLNSPTLYEFYNELLKLLIILFSAQINKSPDATDQKDYFLTLFYLQDRSRLLVRLFSNFVMQQRPFKQASILSTAYSYIFSSSSSPSIDETVPNSPIADKSALLILLLVNQPPETNSFRKAFVQVHDGQEVAFVDIYQAVCNTLEQSEESILILYMLLAHNNQFRSFILSRADPDKLVLPMLKLLYTHSTVPANFAHVYIILVVLLMLSQDGMFNESTQKLVVDAQPWYTERMLKSITLGGLTMVVLVRSIASNLQHQRDLYFHSNAVAALANMSNRMYANHPWVAQRFVGYIKISTGIATDTPVSSNPSDPDVYGDLLAVLLEILTSTLSHSLRHNPQIIYAMLHKQDLFAQLKDARFQPMVETISTVLDFFKEKLKENNDLSQSPEQVMEIVERFSKQWPANRLKPFPELTFRYQEEPDFHMFFLPYLWSIVHRKSLVYWEQTLMLHGLNSVDSSGAPHT